MLEQQLSNVAVMALGSNVTGNYNTAVGQSCLFTNTNSFMAVGYNYIRLNKDWWCECWIWI